MNMETECKIINQTHMYESEFKLKFLGYGEWVEEPDLILVDYKGYEISIKRVLWREIYCPYEAYFGGHLCGYVRIPKSHPYFKTQKCEEIICHGGITYDEKKRIVPHEIGFDCGHSGDYVPTLELFKKQRIESGEFNPPPVPEEFKNMALFNPVYRNLNFCIEECISIVDQLIDIEKVKV